MKTYWLNYGFDVFDPDKTTWNDVAGIYIFAAITPDYKWKAIYIGQAQSFKDRLTNHENWDSAVRLGASHIHAMVVPLAANRDSIEAQLIAYYQPPLNVQLR